ncbi:MULTISPECIES: redox-sensitive transcriptional activator SoxR [unclassified Sulfitobacter]
MPSARLVMPAAAIRRRRPVGAVRKLDVTIVNPFESRNGQLIEPQVMLRSMAKSSTSLPIGKIAARTGLAVSAIRFYEEQRLVQPHRTAAGHRVFTRADIRRLSFVMVAQRLGFSISDIREALSSLPEGRTPTKTDWTRLGQSFRAALDERIAGLTDLRDKLDSCIGCGCLSLKACMLHNTEDVVASRGTGPRYLLGDSPTDI